MNVGIFVSVEVAKAIDDALRLLCRRGVVQPDQRSPVHAFAQQRKVPANRLRVEDRVNSEGSDRLSDGSRTGTGPVAAGGYENSGRASSRNENAGTADSTARSRRVLSAWAAPPNCVASAGVAAWVVLGGGASKSGVAMPSDPSNSGRASDKKTSSGGGGESTVEALSGTACVGASPNCTACAGVAPGWESRAV